MNILMIAGLIALIFGIFLIVLSFFDHRIDLLKHSSDSIINSGATFTSVGGALLALSLQFLHDQEKENTNANIRLSADLRNLERYMLHIEMNADNAQSSHDYLASFCKEDNKTILLRKAGYEAAGHLIAAFKITQAISASFRYETNRFLNENRDSLVNLGKDINLFTKDMVNLVSDQYAMLLQFQDEFDPIPILTATQENYKLKNTDKASNLLSYYCDNVRIYLSVYDSFLDSAYGLKHLACMLAAATESGNVNGPKLDVLQKMTSKFFSTTDPKSVEIYGLIDEAAEKIILDGRKCSGAGQISIGPILHIGSKGLFTNNQMPK